MDANVLLFSLDHPDSLLAHLVDDPEDVDNVVFANPLQDPVQRNEGAASADSSTEDLKLLISITKWTIPHLQWATIGRCSGLTLSLKALTNLTKENRVRNNWI